MATKQDIIDAVAADLGISKKQAGETIDCALANITAHLKKGEEVSLHGFGKFESKHKPARTGHNPATGGTVAIPAKNAPHFSAAKALKDALN